MKTTTLKKLLGGFSAAALVCVAMSSVSQAMSINHGDFDDLGGGGTVMYTDVTESSGTDPVPLFGAPDVSVNLLDFDPTTFSANSGGGGVDFTDGQLNFGIMGVPGAPITTILIREGGDYTLAGVGPATLLGYGIGLRVTVTEIDGVAVTPFDVVGAASGTLSLPGDAGILPGDAGIALPWDLELEFNLGAALVLQEGLEFGTDFTLGVTKAEVSIDDTLFSISRPASVALIAKKNFLINISTDPLDPNDIPEPTTMALALLACCGLGLGSRRNRR